MADSRARRLNPFVTILRERAGYLPDRAALCFRDGAGPTVWTWDTLWRRAANAAAGLRDAGIKPGDHLLMALPDLREAVAGLFGAWAAGAVPIQIGLPFRGGGMEALLPALTETADRLDAKAVVLPLSSKRPFGGAGGLRLIGSDVLAGGTVDPPSATPGPALIQLTSGSIGRPRGVVIPADRLMCHLEWITRALPPGERAVGVSWLPLHHDMGLIGGLLYPLYNGFPVHLLSPLDFRRRPQGWLRTLSEVRATHTAAPPSAFAIATLLARRAAGEGLDLRDLRCAMVGAELIQPLVLRDFAEAFAPCGFRRQAFFPVYGLAEATVAVTFPKPMAGAAFDKIDPTMLQCRGRAVPSDAADALEFTGVGSAIPGTEIRIVGANEDRIVGEIELRSDTAMSGYYREPDATAEAIRDGWLRTGDLGYLADGVLHVTGRSKEIIIRAGRTLLPHAIEEAAETVRGVRRGGTAAVGLPSAARGTERAVLVAETALAASHHPDLLERIADALRGRVLEVDEIRLAPPHSLPRTTSGKLRRRALAQQLLESAKGSPLFAPGSTGPPPGRCEGN